MGGAGYHPFFSPNHLIPFKKGVKTPVAGSAKPVGDALLRRIYIPLILSGPVQMYYQ